MRAEDIQYSFPLGPTYQDDEGKEVLILAKPADTKVNKFIGIYRDDDKLFLFESADLEPYVPKPVDFEINTLASKLTEVLLTHGVQDTVIKDILKTLGNS